MQVSMAQDQRGNASYNVKFHALQALAGAEGGIPREQFVKLLGNSALLDELHVANLVSNPRKSGRVRFHSRGTRWFTENKLLPPRRGILSWLVPTLAEGAGVMEAGGAP